MRARLTTLAACLIGVVAQVSVASAQPDAALQGFAGRWHWVGGERELQALDAAIEACVKKMNVFIRGIARRRIRKPNQPSPELVVAVDGANLAVSRPGRPALAAPTNGAPIKWRDPGGDWFMVSHGVDHGVMFQRFEGTSSLSLNRYTLDPVGQRMVVHTHITSKWLPVPIDFDTTYERSQ